MIKYFMIKGVSKFVVTSFNDVSYFYFCNRQNLQQ